MIGGTGSLPASQVFESVAAMKTSGAPEGSVVSTRGFYAGSFYGGASYYVFSASAYSTLRGNAELPSHASNGGYAGVSYVDHLDASSGCVYVHEGRFSSVFTFESVGGKREPSLDVWTQDSFPAFEALRTGVKQAATILFPAAKFCTSDAQIPPLMHTWLGVSCGVIHGVYDWQVPAYVYRRGTVLSTLGAGTPRIWTDRGGATQAAAWANPYAEWGILKDPPVRVGYVLQPGSRIVDISFEGNRAAPWEHLLLLPACSRIRLERVHFFSDVSQPGVGTLKEAFLIDATWGATKPDGSPTPLFLKHATSVANGGYGREVQAANSCYENRIVDCNFMTGMRGAGIEGHWRNIQRNPDVPNGFMGYWGLGGLSDTHFESCRFGCDNIYALAGYDSAMGKGAWAFWLNGGDVQAKTVDSPLFKFFQNMTFTNCSWRTDNGCRAAMGVEKAQNLLFSRAYGEVQTGWVTQARTATAAASAPWAVVPAPNPMLGAAGDRVDFRKGYVIEIRTTETVYFQREDNFAVGATVTSSSGASFVIRAIALNTDNVLCLYCNTFTGTLNAGDTLTQAAGQGAINVAVADETAMRVKTLGPLLIRTASRSYGADTFNVVSAPEGLFGSSFIDRDTVKMSAPVVSLSSSGSSMSHYLGEEQLPDGTLTYTQRIRWDNDAWYVYSAPCDVGKSTNKFRDGWFSGVLYADSAVLNGKTALTEESGTWTPVLYGGTTAGSPTTVVMSGTYRKVGKQVTATYRVKISAKGGIVGKLYIGGLPFAVNSDSSNRVNAIFDAVAGMVTGTGVPVVRVVSGVSVIEIMRVSATFTVPGDATDANITDAFECRGTIIYLTN